MYEYKVKYVDSDTNEELIEYGLIGGCGCYGDAIERLSCYYGEEYIIKVSLFCVEDANHPLVYKEGVKSLTENFREPI